MGKYAVDTNVSVSKTQTEIEETLTKYGADQFMRGWKGNQAVLAFRLQGRQIRFLLPLPDKEAPEFNQRKEQYSHKIIKGFNPDAWEQACRQRWRALGLVIKAKLEAIECGISTLEDEFMSNIMLPDNTTVGDFMRPQIQQAYLTGTMPTLLPMLPSGN